LPIVPARSPGRTGQEILQAIGSSIGLGLGRDHRRHPWECERRRARCSTASPRQAELSRHGALVP